MQFSDMASSHVAETFVLAVFSLSRGTIVQLRSEENSILHHSRKSDSFSVVVVLCFKLLNFLSFFYYICCIKKEEML